MQFGLRRNMPLLAGIALACLLGVLEITVRIYQHARGRTFEDALYGTHYRDHFFLGRRSSRIAEGLGKRFRIFASIPWAFAATSSRSPSRRANFGF